METNATETASETEKKKDPAEAGPEVSTQLKGKTETIVNQNVECFTHGVLHISSIRLECQRLAALFSPRQCS